MASGFRSADHAEIARLARTLSAARVVDGPAELEALHAAEPWRIRVSDRGDAVVLSRWRDHLPYLAIDALWCPASRITEALLDIRAVADERGFADVVSAPTPVEEMHPYVAEGMRPRTTVATYQLSDLAGTAVRPMPEGLTVRSAGLEEMLVLLDVDARCFDLFWRYDARHLARFLVSSRLAVAEQDGEVLGYTLCTVSGSEGLLGRLCVVPERRREGIGSVLLADAVHHVDGCGGRHVMLSTQTDNATSQRLYREAGFRDTGRRYAFLHFGRDGA
ncbi:MAG: GNAT family N-acetyltransferase [Coriobacteriia bacterium]